MPDPMIASIDNCRLSFGINTKIAFHIVSCSNLEQASTRMVRHSCLAYVCKCGIADSGTRDAYQSADFFLSPQHSRNVSIHRVHSFFEALLFAFQLSNLLFFSL